MLRCRTTKNEIVELPTNARFIEVCEAGGKVALVLAVQSDGSVTPIHPNTIEGERYKKGYGVEWVGTRTVNVGGA